MSTTTLDPSQYAISFLGQQIVGWADGDVCSVEYDADAFTKYVGTGGEGARSKSLNRGATITLRLMSTSPSNDILSAAAEADRLTGQGAGPFFAKDGSGRTAALAPTAWVKKMPAKPFGKEVGEIEWQLDTDLLELFVGGNG